MKKLLVLALALGLCSSACGKKEEAPANDAAAPAAEAAANDAKVADMPNVLTADGKIDKDAVKALYDGKDAATKLATDLLLLKHESAVVRAYVYNRVQRNYDSDTKELQDMVAALKAEKDPTVMAAGLKCLSNNLTKNADLYAYVKEAAASDNKDVRLGAAYGLVNPNNKTADGIYDAAVKLLDDADKDVAGYTCENIARLENAAAKAEIIKRMSGENNDVAAKCAAGVLNLWYNGPFFDKFDAEAYKATLDYLKKTPRAKGVPAWTVISKLKAAPKDAWKAMATDFNAKDLVAALSDIAKDDAAEDLARTNAVGAIATHGEKADLEALKSVTNAKVVKEVEKALSK